MNAPWKPVLVGVDTSPQAATAAQVGYHLAHAAGVSCDLVHAAQDFWTTLAASELPERVAEFTQAWNEAAKRQVAGALRGSVPATLLDAIRVRSGRAAAVLAATAAEVDAGLIVLGGKRHWAVGRWLGSSTSLNLARLTTVPLLVAAGEPGAIRRVLVAVDLSPAARPAVALAARYAGLLGAELRAIHVMQPLPTLPEMLPPVDSAAYYKWSQEALTREVWPLLPPGIDRLVRHGTPVETILREAAEWPADLLVVGSHGKGWAERLLLGSVTERMLQYLPTSLLVVPVSPPAHEAVPSRSRETNRARSRVNRAAARR